MTFTQKELYKPEKFMINVGLQVSAMHTGVTHVCLVALKHISSGQMRSAREARRNDGCSEC